MGFLGTKSLGFLEVVIGFAGFRGSGERLASRCLWTQASGRKCGRNRPAGVRSVLRTPRKDARGPRAGYLRRGARRLIWAWVPI